MVTNIRSWVLKWCLSANWRHGFDSRPTASSKLARTGASRGQDSKLCRVELGQAVDHWAAGITRQRSQQNWFWNRSGQVFDSTQGQVLTRVHDGLIGEPGFGVTGSIPARFLEKWQLAQWLVIWIGELLLFEPTRALLIRLNDLRLGGSTCPRKARTFYPKQNFFNQIKTI